MIGMRIKTEIQTMDITKIIPQQYIRKYISVNQDSLKSNVKNQFQNSVTVSRYLQLDKRFFYNLGLWCGDKYRFGNSVGLTNITENLLNEFKKFLESIVKEKSMVKEILINNGNASRIKINSGLIRRILENLEQQRENLINEENDLVAYLSGRIDADGTIMLYAIKYKTSPIKITYENISEAEKDFELLKRFNLKSWISKYKDRNAFDLKIALSSTLKILDKLNLKGEDKQQKLILIRKLVGR